MRAAGVRHGADRRGVRSDLAVGAVEDRHGWRAAGDHRGGRGRGLDRWQVTNVVLDPRDGRDLGRPAACAGRDRRDQARSHAARGRRDTQSARGRGAARHRRCGGRGRELDRRRPTASSALGARAVLIKGGHGAGAESVDVLFDGQMVTRLAAASASRPATPMAPAARCRLRSPPGSPRARSSRSRRASPRPTSPTPSRRRTGSRSGMGMVRCIISDAVWPSV